MHAQNPHHTQHNGQNKYSMGKSTKRLTSNTAAPASGRVLLTEPWQTQKPLMGLAARTTGDIGLAWDAQISSSVFCGFWGVISVCTTESVICNAKNSGKYGRLVVNE
ncbi:hypothetical protein SV7mr_33000 [Stieleria bergensis]|uniref:Uncharacterized protein n=2 Tax=Stieleria bergensis TaxID=2528025 RepID=A0A517SX98_9BACT|nr:hypothetical protein SV7mr_33000 [Planctomycetes bacterium SV_7m_r]